MKVMTIRLEDESAATLDLVARVEAIPLVEIVRRALDAYIDTKRADPEFRRRVDALLEVDSLIARRLAED